MDVARWQEMADLILAMDYLGTFLFAVTGASIAIKIEMDLFGVIFLAFITAVGGGTFRDLILSQPVFWTENERYIYVILLAVVATLILRQISIRRVTPMLFLLDTIALGTFAMIGVQKALIFNGNYIVALVLGITTGVLGGIIRSLFSKELSILYNKELYATVAGASALIFIVLSYFETNGYIAVGVTILCTVFLRYASVRYDIKLPKFKTSGDETSS